VLWSLGNYLPAYRTFAEAARADKSLKKLEIEWLNYTDPVTYGTDTAGELMQTINMALGYPVSSPRCKDNETYCHAEV
jgi:hypothetical protein